MTPETPERLEVAIEVVGRLADLAGNVEQEPRKATAMAGHLTLAHGYLVEYFTHLARGCEPQDALLKTIRGELPIGDPRDEVAA